jgi:hypothetical protein
MRKNLASLFHRLYKPACACIAMIGLMAMLSAAPKSQVGGPTPEAPGTLDDATLTATALAIAQTYGLQGSATATTDVRMSLAEWNTLIDAELGEDAAQFGLTPDMPVFVLALRGKVVWQGFDEYHSSNDAGSNERTQCDNMTIVLNAKTGDLFMVQCDPPGRSMPVPVP